MGTTQLLSPAKNGVSSSRRASFSRRRLRRILLAVLALAITFVTFFNIGIAYKNVTEEGDGGGRSNDDAAAYGRGGSLGLWLADFIIEKNDDKEDGAAEKNKADEPSSPLLPPMKIVGFSDRSYWPVTKRWYDMMTSLGYKEHVIVAIDEDLASILESLNEKHRLEREGGGPDKRKEDEDGVHNEHPREPLYRYEKYLRVVQRGSRPLLSLWYLRINYLRETIHNGTSVLITDVDNVFRRYVPLSTFYNDDGGRYDIIQAYEGRFPVPVFEKQGFVVCAGMAWFRANERTLAFLDAWQDHCVTGGPRNRRGIDACNDQESLNSIMYDENSPAHVTWEWTDNQRGPTAIRNDDGLLTMGMVGHGPSGSGGTNHTVKIWDRDFAWRGNSTQLCPPLETNWVTMPGPLVREYQDNVRKIPERLERLDYWEEFCGMNGTRRNPTIDDPGMEAFLRAKAKRKAKENK